MGVPTTYAALAEHMQANPTAAASLARGRLFTSGSAALSAELWETFVELSAFDSGPVEPVGTITR